MSFSDHDFQLQRLHDEAVESRERAAIRAEHWHAGNGKDPDAGEPEPRFRIVSDLDFESRPIREMLVENAIPAGGLVLVYGAPDSMKTFFAVLVAYSIVTGRPVHSLSVVPGPVLYILGEGGGRFGLRTRAWRTYHETDATPGFYLLPDAVQFSQPGDVAALLAAIEQLPEKPALIVIDTLARCLVGGDENSARDTGLFIAGLERLRRQTDAAIMVVHHTSKNGTTERGSSALRGAFETVISVAKDGDFVTVACERQKDGDRFDSLTFRKHVIELGGGETSCVLLPVDERQPHQRPRTIDEMSGSARRALDALREHFDEDGATTSEWLRVSGIPERSFYRAIKDLKRWEYIRSKQNRHRPEIPCD